MRLIYYFDYLSHHLTWHCFSISEDLHRFEILLLFLNNVTAEKITKAILCSYGANFLQIYANLQISCNNMMSNDGFIIEYKDLSCTHLAVHATKKCYECRGSDLSHRKIQPFAEMEENPWEWVKFE